MAKPKPRKIEVTNWQEQEAAVKKRFDDELAELHPKYVELDGKLQAFGIVTELSNGFHLNDTSFEAFGMTIVQKTVSSAGWTLRGTMQGFFHTLKEVIDHLQDRLTEEEAVAQ